MGATFQVLDKGSITLVDYLGTDETIVAAARHSYGGGLDVEDHEGNARLINFLMREKHSSPFEQPAMVFEVKAPIFVFREWHRHRTAKLNEMSGRYTELMQEFYTPNPERVQAQSKSNKQGSGPYLGDDISDWFIEAVDAQCISAFDAYRRALNEGVSKELARIVLPVNTYSKMVWQCDLSNLLNFIRLRSAPTAQWEIRQFSDQIALAVQQSFPKVWAAFDEHVLGAVTLSRSERRQLLTAIEEDTVQAYEKLMSKLAA